jgi:hypothetical protein
MGFQNGLRACRRLLRSGGYAAVTEAVFLTSDRPDPVTQFWEREYPDIRNVPTTIETIEKTGFRLAAHFTLPKSAWMDYFYTPIERRIEELAATYRDNAEALQVFGTCLEAMEVFKRYSNYFGYEFFIMQKE